MKVVMFPTDNQIHSIISKVDKERCEAYLDILTKKSIDPMYFIIEDYCCQELPEKLQKMISEMEIFLFLDNRCPNALLIHGFENLSKVLGSFNCDKSLFE